MTMRVMLTLLDRLGQPLGAERSALMATVDGAFRGIRWQLIDPVQWVHINTPIRAIAVRELPDRYSTNGRRWCVPITLAPNPPLTHVFTLRRLDDLPLPGLPGDPDDMTAPDPFAEPDTDTDTGQLWADPIPPQPLTDRQLFTRVASTMRVPHGGIRYSEPDDDDRPLVAHLERAHGRWRVGRHFPEHVYDGDTPVATFVGDRVSAAANARAAVLDHNRMVPGIPDGEWVVIPPAGWANRVDELLNRYGIDIRTPMDPSKPDEPRLGAALVELVREWGVQG